MPKPDLISRSEPETDSTDLIAAVRSTLNGAPDVRPALGAANTPAKV